MGSLGWPTALCEHQSPFGVKLCWKQQQRSADWQTATRLRRFLHTNNKPKTTFLVILEGEWCFSVFSDNLISESLSGTVQSLQSLLCRTCIDSLFPWTRWCWGRVCFFVYVVVVSTPAVLISRCFNAACELLGKRLSFLRLYYMCIFIQGRRGSQEEEAEQGFLWLEGMELHVVGGLLLMLLSVYKVWECSEKGKIRIEQLY